MQLEKRDINIFLVLWIKNDKELWSELRQLEIKLLVDRIVKEKSYHQLAIDHGTTIMVVKGVLNMIYKKIDRFISTDVAKHLRIIDAKLQARPDKPFTHVEYFMN